MRKALTTAKCAMTRVTLEQSHQQLYDACKAMLVMIDFYSDPQFNAVYPRIDSPRLLLIRQAVLNAEELIKEMSDGKTV